MSWKNWSYWLKGGFVFLGLYIIVNILTSLSLFFGEVKFFLISLSFTSSFPMAFLIIKLFGPVHILRFDNMWIGFVIFLLINSIFWFIIGSLMGWIYGKIKSRNKGVK